MGECKLSVYAAPMTTVEKSHRHYDGVRPIVWEDGKLQLIDQRKLPQVNELFNLPDIVAASHAIRDMVVRGAPAIGITAAYAVVIAARARFKQDSANWMQLLEADMELLAKARPTAINLAWAIDQMRLVIDDIKDGDPSQALEQRAIQIHQQDIAANYKMGKLGSDLLGPKAAVLTHCNAGSLATGGYGTALGVIRHGFADGKITEVFADETRPWMQGARLTAWEMVQEKIPVTLLVEGAAATLMAQGKIGWVIVGADRIAANGDVANKIGTYSLAVNARHHGVKFMVVAPTSTVDMGTDSGADIPIEQRPADEVLACGGGQIAAEGAKAWNPAFDITPAELVDVIVTQKGIVESPNPEKIAKMMRI